MSKIITYEQYISKVSDFGFSDSIVQEIWKRYQKLREDSLANNKPFEISDIGLLTKYYDLGITIGRGAQGFVKIGKNKKTGRVSALKFIYTKDIDEKKLKEEYEIMYDISKYPVCHPNIVCYEDLFETTYGKYNNKKYYILQMELFKGREILDLINCALATKIKIPNTLTRLIIQDILKALNYIHSKNIVHRDIKPNNVMFNDQGIKIVDFGFACYVGKCEYKVGTRIYFSPEKANPGKNYDQKKADLWAAGIILLEMLVEEDLALFLNDLIINIEEESNNKLMADIVDVTIRKSSKIPKDIRSLLVGLLKFNPDERITASKALSMIKGKIGTYEELWKFWTKCDKENKKVYS